MKKQSASVLVVVQSVQGNHLHGEEKIDFAYIKTGLALAATSQEWSLGTKTV